MEIAGPADPATLDDATRQFAKVCPKLIGLAYSMLGSRAEAEEIVQEVWLRWRGVDRSGSRSTTAFLMTMTIRLAIGCARSAQVRRETYVGPWLPEPVDTSLDPQVGTEQYETLSFAVLSLMEELNPTERAAYILREASDFPYALVAAIVQTSEGDARQLVRQAREHLKIG
ncbi:sigma factor [Streptomyces sp. NPDC046977]|uniref:sigma factor n=1 Tax=Streptomyces sp. NPDC046977 TaxID=3154703 RepID=UPI0033CC85E9